MGAKPKLSVIRPARRTAVQRELLVDAIGHADCRPATRGREKLVGYAIVSVTAGGLVDKSIYMPNGNGITNTMFRALLKQGLDDIIATKIAEDRAWGVVNEASGIDPDDNDVD